MRRRRGGARAGCCAGGSSSDTDALAAARDAGNRDQQAHTHARLGQTHYAIGHPEQARYHWQQAVIRYTELGGPEADPIRAHLLTLRFEEESADLGR